MKLTPEEIAIIKESTGTRMHSLVLTVLERWTAESTETLIKSSPTDVQFMQGYTRAIYNLKKAFTV